MKKLLYLALFFSALVVLVSFFFPLETEERERSFKGHSTIWWEVVPQKRGVAERGGLWDMSPLEISLSSSWRRIEIEPGKFAWLRRGGKGIYILQTRSRTLVRGWSEWRMKE